MVSDLALFLSTIDADFAEQTTEQKRAIEAEVLKLVLQCVETAEPSEKCKNVIKC